MLRWYQKKAVEKIMWALSLDGNDVVVLPTGSGKSHVIAEVAGRIADNVLILQPNKEILEQNLEKLLQYVPKENIGVYSASMREKTVRKITFGTIGTVRNNPGAFVGVKLVLIDECHLVPIKDMGSMFMSFIKAIGSPKIIGLTATPYRMDVTYRPDGWGGWNTYTTTKIITRTKGLFWRRILLNVNVEDLIKEGYLCRLKYYDNSKIGHSEIPTNKSMSDFDLEAYENLLLPYEQGVLQTISRAQKVSRSVLVFNSSVAQAERMAKAINGEVVTAKTKAKDRERIIDEFKQGNVKTVFNVGVLTTGFDHPALDTIVLLRPTRSIGLYYQMLGRGLRTAPGKEFCRVIDFTGTVRELGRIESIRLVRRKKQELESNTGSWHNKILYSYHIQNEN